MTEPDYDDELGADLRDDEPDAQDSGVRRRALVALLGLAVVAGLISGLMVLFIGGSGGSGGSRHAAAPQPTAAAPQPTPPTSQPPTSQPPTSEPPTSQPPTSGAASIPGATVNPVHPCPSAAACALPGDGGLVAAINALRGQHGLKPVAGSATPQAQQCALAQGEGAACAGHYAWQPAPAMDAGKVIGKVAPDWLLDPGMTSFSVGWSYTPGPNGAAGQYACAILKTG